MPSDWFGLGIFFFPRWCPKLLPKQLHWSRGSAPVQAEPHVCFRGRAALQQCQRGQCDPGGGVERLCAAWHTWGVCRVCTGVRSHRIQNSDFGRCYVEAVTCLLAISVWRRSCWHGCQRKTLTDWLPFKHFEYFECWSTRKWNLFFLTFGNIKINLFFSNGQVREFYLKVLNEEERQRLCKNIAEHLKDAQLFIQKRAVSALFGVYSRFSINLVTLS